MHFGMFTASFELDSLLQFAGIDHRSINLTVLSPYTRDGSCSLKGFELVETRSFTMKCNKQFHFYLFVKWWYKKCTRNVAVCSHQNNGGRVSVELREWSNGIFWTGSKHVVGLGEVVLHWLGCGSREAECEGRQATVTLGRFKSPVLRQPIDCLSCTAARVEPQEFLVPIWAQIWWFRYMLTVTVPFLGASINTHTMLASRCGDYFH